ncbi:MAG TPA: exonuclease domain-containing protein [Pseudonocardiaceae bacterium]|nr:exonuclease domain-containing protein [Pseudonocardiaceae bacterium]
MTDWTQLRYVVVDVEGNGQQPPDLVELAAVPITGGVIGEPQTWLVRPDLPITGFARKIHGISNEQVADAPTFGHIEPAVLKALDADVLVAHAAHVDVGVLQRKLGDWECPEVFDTLKLARRLLPDHDSYKLGSLADALSLVGDLSTRLKPHRATYDALICARLFVHLAGHHTLEELRDRPPEEDTGDAPSLF